MTRRVVEVASVIRLGEESVIIRWPQDGRGLLPRGQLARVSGGELSVVSESRECVPIGGGWRTSRCT